ncbi:class I SAM-dependent methyltransferase [Pseudofrankia sp. DC12]|uniref:class I SAM-dependent methyltransferase n=1 Tax=Pseudofrankia sp. DC12 TaxID=683315 RepID=UPI00069913F3|nr:class I SAM-dependent methyltransferase [Pseudofrankia sp. DC12]
MSDTATGGPAGPVPPDRPSEAAGATQAPPGDGAAHAAGTKQPPPAGDAAAQAAGDGTARAADPDRLPISSAALSARPYVRSASAAQTGGNGVLATEAPVAPAAQRAVAGLAAKSDGRGEGALRASFADLAARAAEDGAGELAVFGQQGQPERHDPAVGPDGPVLLLRSVVDLREVWVPLLAAAGARSVALLGTEHGQTTALLVELLRAGGGGRLLVVDPEPGRVPAAGRGLDIEVVREYGAAGLDGHTPTDAYLIDGDANFATVTRTLAAVADAVHEFGRASFPLILLHDVGWPTGWRDRYTSPDRLTAADRQPFTWDGGVTLDRDDAVPGRGLRGDGAYAWALAEGGPRNGVRSAVEQFVAGHPELRFFTVAPIFGLGIIVDRRAPYAARIADLLAPWVSNPLLARLERNRLDLYLRVVAQRDDAIAAAQSHHRDVSRLDAERLRLIAIDIEKSDRIAELERALADERATTADALNARLEEPRLVAAARSADSRLRARFRRGPSKLELARARLAEEERRRRDGLDEPGSAGGAGRLALTAGGGGGVSGVLEGRGGPRALPAGPAPREPAEAAGPIASWGAGPAQEPGGLGDAGQYDAGRSGAGQRGVSQTAAGDGAAAALAAGPDAAARSAQAGREAVERLRGRHRLHQPTAQPDLLSGGRGEQAGRLWTPTRTSAAPSRKAPEMPEPARRSRRPTARDAAAPAPDSGHPTPPAAASNSASGLPGPGTGAVLLPPAPAMLPPFEVVAAAASVPPTVSTKAAPPAPSAPSPGGSRSGPSAAGAAPAGPAPAGAPPATAGTGPAQAPAAPIQSGQPIAAGQSIPPGSAVQPGKPAEPGAAGQPQLFDRSGVPRRRRMPAASNQERHEPRHRAAGRNHNPDRPS